MDLARARDVALAAVEESDALALRWFAAEPHVERKADGSPVTVADREVEALVRGRLAAAFPDHAQLGEEGGGAIDPSVPTWVVDPIDATKNFVRGLPMWATLVALVVDGEAVVGVASAPAMGRRGERWHAARGLGARLGGEAVHVSEVAALGDAHVLHGGLDAHRAEPGGWELLGRVADRAWRTRGLGDFWMHLLVAAGHADVAFERDVKPWDVAAVAAIVTEAGGRCTGWDGGSPLVTGDVASTNGAVHDELLALLAASPR